MDDVVVVGAGPGGSATAHYLARAGVRVALLDKSEFPRDKTCGDAITPRAMSVLDDMGVLPEIEPAGCLVRELRVVGPSGRAFELARPAQGRASDRLLVVPRKYLDAALCRRATATGARFCGEVNVVSIEPVPGGVAVHGQYHGERVSFPARLAVIATGASTRLLTGLGILQHPPLFALAARAYFEGLGNLSGRAELRFDGVPLPGYGWIFPLPGDAANVGAGFLPRPGEARAGRKTTRSVLADFLEFPPILDLLGTGRQVGPVRRYQFRMFFRFAPTSGDRLLLVGEAAGLANPLTAEGIGYALESGRIAAEHILRSLASGDFSRGFLARYDRLLRRRFHGIFRVCSWIRSLGFHPFGLDAMTWLAARHRLFRRQILDLILDAGEFAHTALPLEDIVG